MKKYLVFLKNLIEKQIEDKNCFEWYQEQNKLIEGKKSNSFEFDISFGLVSRKVGKNDLYLTKDDLTAANHLRKGFNPSRWTIDTAIRVYFLLKYSEGNEEAFKKKFEQLYKFADGHEAIALFSGLPLFPSSNELTNIVTNALRTNVKSEFESIAHHNPYPFEQFNSNAWNNLVLKSLFIGVMLNPILGLDNRINVELARILKDYANERWAAKRFVSPELWRCVGPIADTSFISDLKYVLINGLEIEKKAVALSLSQSKNKDIKHELGQYLQNFEKDIKEGSINWNFIQKDLIQNSLAYTQKLNKEEKINDVY
ncbi:EboA domain-containing protein [Candidatus Levibacter sp. Uisw_134_01]|jgi:hypothetical protein|uniref:EboA domain-containing protein n=1 Tax=Candidatus Levibacter sp. Uisw_134_01 TaxID=3230999 RepID=UPI003D50603B